jgi:hypothetical protein
MQPLTGKIARGNRPSKRPIMRASVANFHTSGGGVGGVLEGRLLGADLPSQPGHSGVQRMCNPNPNYNLRQYSNDAAFPSPPGTNRLSNRQRAGKIYRISQSGEQDPAGAHGLRRLISMINRGQHYARRNGFERRLESGVMSAHCLHGELTLTRRNDRRQSSVQVQQPLAGKCGTIGPEGLDAYLPGHFR